MYYFQGVCTEAGMYALRERRVHVTQEDFELAVAKVSEMLSKSLGCSPKGGAFFYLYMFDRSNTQF